MHTTEKPALEKISRAFAGKSSKTNIEILKTLIVDGPMSPYGLYKKLSRIDYSVVNRRIRNMENSEYVSVVARKIGQRSQKEVKIYGLTLRGFLLALIVTNYDDKVEQIMNANAENVQFCLFFSEVLRKKRLTRDEIKTIFLDHLKAYVKTGWNNVDVIMEYFLFKYAQRYINHNARELIQSLPEQKKRLVKQVLEEFRRLTHPETTENFLIPLLNEDGA